MGHDLTNLLATLKTRFEDFLGIIIFKCIVRSLQKVLNVLRLVSDVGAVIVQLVDMKGLVRKFSETLMQYGRKILTLKDAEKQAMVLAQKCDILADDLEATIAAHKA
ncbi:hypothetical protein RSOLAG22IIIB_08182 [Rhizoctonia solani]|uniref:Uncharacterized protein n=1 Tax=Rhizoctonia solani TaxID=456999 RepID=A0A0K6FRW7_9AGAM|nr:hypothetical protein RSOLAG22IIIB_08182 [Rhizoctonia solani]